MSDARERRVVSSPELVVAEVALTAVTAATVLGFARVLDGGFLGPLLAVTVATHLAAAACRRRAWSVPRSAAVVLATGAVLLTWLLFFHTTVLALPTPSTLDAAADALAQAWTTFQDASAPAPVEPGFLLAAGGALVFAAFLADWAAFRLWSPFEAVVPTTTLFVFCSLLGGTQHQVASAAAFAGAVVAFLLAHRVARRVLGGSWVTEEVQRGSRSLLVSGAVLGTLAVVAGVAAGPRLPGAEDDAVLEWRSDQEQSSQRVTISPLVDIRARLVDQQDVEVFRVQAAERSYWRLTSLDTFEDGIWKSSGRYSSVNGDLPGEPSDADGGVPDDQVFTITALSALWLPAAFEPAEVEAPTDVRYHEGSSTLIVDTDVNDSDGFVYRVRSVLPRHTPDELRAAGDAIPEDVAEEYLALPANVSSLAQQTATAWTEGAATAYDKALALQDQFQQFTYSLDVPPGHSANAIDAFLQIRTGYCEQFAGTFAVMARQLGIPARVAVGFTPGEQDPADPTLYRVRGEHAHAWPEVWLGDAGWVAFEPTPGRGAPGAEAYTGLAPAQDTSGPATSPTTQAPSPETVPGTSIDPSAPTPSTTAPEIAPAVPPALGGGDDGGGPDPVEVVLALLAVVGLAYLVAVPTALAARRRLRHQRARTPAARVRLAWLEATDALTGIGLPQLAHETAAELAPRAGARLPSVAEALDRLAEATDVALFAPGDEVPEAVAAAAEHDAEVIAATAAARLSRRRRVLRQLDVRRLADPSRPSGARHVVGSRGTVPPAQALGT